MGSEPSRPPSRRRPRGLALAAVGLIALIIPLQAAWAATGAKLAVSGSVVGNVARGGRLTLHMSGLDTAGWRSLHQLKADLVIGGEVVQPMTFDIEDNQLTVGEMTVPVGTGAIGVGSYLSVAAPDVIVTTGGSRMEFTAKMIVQIALPPDASFRLGLVDDFGQTRAITRHVSTPTAAGSGFTWGTVIAAVAIALFAGGFAGSLLASRRRPPARASIYATVQRRIEQERSSEQSGASKPAG